MWKENLLSDDFELDDSASQIRDHPKSGVGLACGRSNAVSFQNPKNVLGLLKVLGVTIKSE
jgi:hypothetical protein